jgi:hypothetical protein
VIKRGYQYFKVLSVALQLRELAGTVDDPIVDTARAAHGTSRCVNGLDTTSIN